MIGIKEQLTGEDDDNNNDIPIDVLVKFINKI